MFDTLTLDELYALHTKLCAEHAANHARLMDKSLPIFGAAYAVLDARQAEVSETADAVFAEIRLRDKENFADA